MSTSIESKRVLFHRGNRLEQLLFRQSKIKIVDKIIVNKIKYIKNKTQEQKRRTDATYSIDR